MISFSENDPITRLVKAHAALVDDAPFMSWEEFSAKHGHHLPGQHTASGSGPVFIIGLVLVLNGFLLALSFPLFLQKWESMEVVSEAKAVCSGIAASLELPAVIEHAFQAANSGDENPEADDVISASADKPTLRRVNRNAVSSPATDTEILSQKINQYFEQLKSDNPSQAAEKYLRSLLKAKDSLDRAFQGVYDTDLEFGVVRSGDRHYAEYLEPRDFVRLAKEKNAVVLDLRKPQDFEQAHLRQAVSAEYNLRYLQQVSEEIPKNKAIFLYGDVLKECESAKAFLWKNGFRTVYILNKPFNPNLFRKSDLVTSTR